MKLIFKSDAFYISKDSSALMKSAALIYIESRKITDWLLQVEHLYLIPN